MNRLIAICVGLLVVTVAAGLFVHQHVKFGPEDLPGFYAGVGLLGAALVVVMARLLGPLLRHMPPAEADHESSASESQL